MLELQERSLLKKTWKPMFFALEGPDIVYGTPTAGQAMSSSARFSDVADEVGRFSMEKTWSVFERDGDGYMFEVHNPRSTSQTVMKAATRELRQEWISRLKQRIREIEEGRVAPRSTGGPARSEEESARSGENMRQKEITDALVAMGFLRSHAEKAAASSADMNQALEEVMKVQLAAADTSSAMQASARTSSVSSGSRSRLPSSTSAGTGTTGAGGGGHRGMAKCGNCGSGFSYPVGATRVQCHSCGVINNLPGGGDQPKPDTVELQCGFCKTRVALPMGQKSFTCAECSVENSVP